MLRKIAKKLDLTRSDDIAFGSRSGYTVTFVSTEKELELFVDARLVSVDAPVIDTLKQYVQSQSSSFCLKSFSMSATGASVTVAKKDSELLLDFFPLFLKRLRDLGVPGDSVCSNCGRPLRAEPRYVRLSNHAHSCDPACAERLLAKPAAAKKSGARPHGSVLGFTGGLLACLLAAALYFRLGAAGRYCAWSAALFPILTYYGYKFLGGKGSVGRGLTVILLPLLFFALTAGALLCYLVFLNWRAGDYVFTLNELVQNVRAVLAQSGEIRQSALLQVYSGGVFLLIGYIYTLPIAFAKRRPPNVSLLHFGTSKEAAHG